MIDCWCINDYLRPNEIPIEKWVIKDEKYRITDVARLLPQNVLGYSLYEKPLIDCAPYEYFISTRFAVKPEDIQKLIDIWQQKDIDISEIELQELFENSNLQTI